MMTASMFQKMERLIYFLEKERLNLVEIFIFVFVISLFRSWIEAWSFGVPTSSINNAHTTSFYFCIFTGGVFILKLITRERVIKIANLTCLGFLILPMAPIIDRFVFHRVVGYDYLPKRMFLDVFFTSTGPPEYAGLAQMLMLWIIIILATMYVYIKTRSFGKTVVNFFIFYFFIVAISMPTLNSLIFDENFTYPQNIFFLYYVILTGVFIALILKISKKSLLSSLVKSLRPLTTIHAIAMVFLGIFIAGQTRVNELLKFPFTGSLGHIGMSMFTIIFLWWFTIMINHVYDIEIDKITDEYRVLTKKMLTISQVKQIAIIFGILSVMLALLLGYVIIPVVIALILAIIYSVPPFRFRNYIFSATFIGIGSTLAFFTGCLTFPPPTYIPSTIIPTIAPSPLQLPPYCLPIGIIILIALSTGPVIKDLKDYTGDKKMGVKNIFTVFGMEKGIKIASILLFLSFFSPILLFHEILDFLVLVPMSIVVMFLFKRFKSVELVFGMYFLVLVYCIARWIHLI